MKTSKQILQKHRKHCWKGPARRRDNAIINGVKQG